MTSRAVDSLIPPGVRSKAGALHHGVAEFASRRIVWLIAIVDVLLLTVSVDLAVWLRLEWYHRGWPNFAPIDMFTGATVFTVMSSIACLYIFELYSPKELRRISNVAARLVMVLLATLGIISVISFWGPPWKMFRGFQVYFALIAFVLLTGWRWIAFHAVEHWLAATRVVLVGDTPRLQLLEEAFRAHPWSKLQIGSRISTEEAEGFVEAGHAQLLQAARASGATTVIASFGGLPSDGVLHELLHCKGAGLQVIDGTTLYKSVTGRVPIRLADKNWLAFGPDFNLSGNVRARVAQRGMDIVLGAVGLVLASPLMLLAGLAIYAVDRGSPLFRQERVGENGRRYWLLKLRTMRLDAEKDGPRWAEKHDDRLLPGGRFLRATRLDELPQLWNVLKGEMSFIGPRPERPYFVESLSKSIPFYTLRFSVKPGLTGWAQVNYGYGSSEEDAAVKLEYELYYIQEMSLYLNLLILLRTVSTVLFRRGT